VITRSVVASRAVTDVAWAVSNQTSGVLTVKSSEKPDVSMVTSVPPV
jgi:hypothetical protein